MLWKVRVTKPVIPTAIMQVKTQTPNPKPQTPNPKPQTPNPKPQTPNPKPQQNYEAMESQKTKLLIAAETAKVR